MVEPLNQTMPSPDVLREATLFTHPWPTHLAGWKEEIPILSVYFLILYPQESVANQTSGKKPPTQGILLSQQDLLMLIIIISN